MLARLLVVLPVVGAVLLTSAPAQAQETPTTLNAKVLAALANSSARVVSAAVDVDGLGAVTRRSATASVPPASTQKLFTAAAALRRLGPSYVEKTQIRSVGTRAGALLRGDLYLVASGDPYFTSAQLDALAASFARTGIRTISGHLVVDDTRYDRVRRGSGWKTEWVPGESGPLSAMALNGNSWRTDSGYVADPATPVLAKLRTYLANRGVRLTTSDNRRGASLASAKTYASWSSTSMARITQRFLKDSDNFAAELVLKELGRVASGQGTAKAGAAVVHQQTGPVGAVADGSGLSLYDRQTTANELALLSSAFGELKTKLPVACHDGTLKNRFCGTVAAQRVFAKTGTLDTARALAGWTYTRDGRLVTFAFVLSGYSSGSAAVKAIDRAVVVLAGATVT